MKSLRTLFLLATMLLSTVSTLQAATPLKDGSFNALKMTFLSLGSGSTKVSFERALSQRDQSAEFCVGVIGLGYDRYHNNPRGLTARYAHKFFLAPREGHPLDGFYLRPEGIWSRYTYDGSSVSDDRQLAHMAALVGTAGVQWSWNHFIADAWLGAGPACGTPAPTFYHHGFALWNYLGSTNEHLALSFSIRLGYCF